MEDIGIFNVPLVYFTAIWYILWTFLWTFGIFYGHFCGHLVYFTDMFVVIWYILRTCLWSFGIFFPVFGISGYPGLVQQAAPCHGSRYFGERMTGGKLFCRRQ
jgi:hypothetical protein